MSELDLDMLRHALQVGRSLGCGSVKVSEGEIEFEAKLGPPPPEAVSLASSEPQYPEIGLFTVRAPAVGYLRVVGEKLEPGRHVRAGEVVAEVLVLGLPTDVACPEAGEVLELLVQDGDPVEFDQEIARLARPR